MDEKERQDILRVLDESIDVLKKGDIKILKQISDHTIHDAAIYQDEYSVAFAVLIYSLSKVHERELHYMSLKGWKNFCEKCYLGLEAAREKLLRSDFLGFADSLKRDLLAVTKLDPKLKNYIGDVLQKARINKASRLYEHGLSMGRTAELLGINRFELMDYVGKTYIADVKETITMSVKKRLELARELFS